MKKEFIKRALLGFPLGIAMGHVISIIASFIFANGYYGAVHPDLIITFGNEINAVIIQTFLYGVIGFVYAGISVVWENDCWGLGKQTITVLSVYLITMIPIACVLKWIQPIFGEIMLFISFYVVIFLVIWIGFYLYNKKSVSKMNEKLKDKKGL